MRLIVLGFLAGLLVWYFIFRPYVPTLTRYLLRRSHARQMERNRPPKGTRPGVRLVYDDITYDLTDTLIRVSDRPADGWARWVVIGPQHLRIRVSRPPMMEIAHPIPLDTAVLIDVTGEPEDARFYTPDEIAARYHTYL